MVMVVMMLMAMDGDDTMMSLIRMRVKKIIMMVMTETAIFMILLRRMIKLMIMTTTKILTNADVKYDGNDVGDDDKK